MRKLEGLCGLERWWAEHDSRYPDGLPAAEFHWLLALRKGLLSLEAHVKWCDESIRRIEARMPKKRGRKIGGRGESTASKRSEKG